MRENNQEASKVFDKKERVWYLNCIQYTNAGWPAIKGVS